MNTSSAEGVTVGMDFVALMRYSRTDEVVQTIKGLEHQTRPLSPEVRELWREFGFFTFDWKRAYWISHDWGHRAKRPRGPDLTVALRTVDGFFLTFGQDTCCVYHLLRWRFFLVEPRWQTAMLRACEEIADLLRSPDVALMSHWHPSCLAFFAGAGFDACLRAAVGQEVEVAQIVELYQEPDEGTWDSHGFWRLRSSAARPAGPPTTADGDCDPGRLPN